MGSQDCNRVFDSKEDQGKKREEETIRDILVDKLGLEHTESKAVAIQPELYDMFFSFTLRGTILWIKVCYIWTYF